VCHDGEHRFAQITGIQLQQRDGVLVGVEAFFFCEISRADATEDSVNL
jgi:hypothetical protein